MFYDTKLNNHNLPHNPFKACVVPRPIGWITTMSEDGVINIGPYSYFNAVSDIPPIVMFASSFKTDGGHKDSITNIQNTGQFVVNIATYAQRDDVGNSSSPLPFGVSEAKEFGIELTPSQMVKPPSIKASPIHLECEYIKTVQLEVGGIHASSEVVFGYVIGVHIDDALIENDRVNIMKLQPIARLGYDEYAIIDHIFRMKKA